MTQFSNLEDITRNEHIGPDMTGDNIDAKRVATYLWDGANWVRQRAATTFKSANTSSAGSTALWTPTAGKRFRLLAYDMQVTANTTQSVAGVLTATLYDGATPTAFAHDIFVPSAAGQANFAFDSGWHNLDGGYLSIAADNVLNINLSAALTAGKIRFVVMGSEEG